MTAAAIGNSGVRKFRGDLRTLDLVGTLEDLGYPVIEAAPGKYWVRCPWSHEHGFTGRSDSVVWQPGDSWPEFHCSHDHCAHRKLGAILEWAESLRPGIIDEHCSGVWTPNGVVSKSDYQRREPRDRTIKVEKPVVSDEEAVRNSERVLGDFRVDESDIFHASVIYPGEDWRHDSILLFEHLYGPEEFVCICTDYELKVKPDGTKKGVPKGSGVTKSAARWIETIEGFGTPEGPAGAWIRLNPVAETGNGIFGAHLDSNVTQHRYMLLESDALPIELQLSLFARLALPIAAIVTSGGKSVHAWVKLDSDDSRDFRAQVDHILARLAQFRVDQQNKNPSRYGRLPGALREIGTEHPGRQKLLYLNPDPKGAIFS